MQLVTMRGEGGEESRTPPTNELQAKGRERGGRERGR